MSFENQQDSVVGENGEHRHTFCYICIVNWSALRKLCPLCKKNFVKRPLEIDLIATQLVGDLTVRCAYCLDWIGFNSQLTRHQRNCLQRPRHNTLDPAFFECAVEVEDSLPSTSDCSIV